MAGVASTSERMLVELVFEPELEGIAPCSGGGHFTGLLPQQFPPASRPSVSIQCPAQCSAGISPASSYPARTVCLPSAAAPVLAHSLRAPAPAHTKVRRNLLTNLPAIGSCERTTLLMQ